MKKSTNRIALDLRDSHSGIELNIKKDDTARKIYFIIQEGGKPYVLERNIHAKLKAKKPSGAVVITHCIVDFTNQHVLYQLHDDIDDEVGLVECELILYDLEEEDQINTPKFDIRVDDVLGGEEDDG